MSSFIKTNLGSPTPAEYDAVVAEKEELQKKVEELNAQVEELTKKVCWARCIIPGLNWVSRSLLKSAKPYLTKRRRTDGCIS